MGLHLFLCQFVFSHLAFKLINSFKLEVVPYVPKQSLNFSNQKIRTEDLFWRPVIDIDKGGGGHLTTPS
jgi:hypothetical protein